MEKIVQSLESMNLEEEKLRLSSPDHDYSYSKSDYPLCKSLNSYYIQNWYQDVKELTFESEFFTLSQDEVLSLLSFLEKTQNKQNQEIILKLENKLDDFIQNLPFKQFFFKFDFRSPKDGFSLKHHLIEKRSAEYEKIYYEKFEKYNVE